MTDLRTVEAVLLPVPAVPTVEAAIEDQHPETAEPNLLPEREPAPPPPHLHKRHRHLDGATPADGVQLKIGVGILRSVNINTVPGGMNGVLTIRDGGQGGGRVIAVITPTTPVALGFDLPFEKGLWVLLTGATPGDWTIAYE